MDYIHIGIWKINHSIKLQFLREINFIVGLLLWRDVNKFKIL